MLSAEVRGDEVNKSMKTSESGSKLVQILRPTSKLSASTPTLKTRPMLKAVFIEPEIFPNWSYPHSFLSTGVLTGVSTVQGMKSAHV